MKPRRTQHDATSAFDAIIPDLYDALLQPEMWPAVLARVAEAANVHAIQFLFADHGGRLLMSETSPLISAENHALYRDHYGAIDPRRMASGTLAVDEFLLCHRICDDDFVRKSEFYNDFIIANGFRYLAGTRLLHADGYDAMFGFHKAVGTDPFDDKEVEAFKTLTPHLRRVAQLKYRFATLEAKAATLSAALDLSGSALAIVSADFKVRHVNEAAEVLLRAGEGLRLRQRRLVAADVNVAKQLDRLIAEAAECAAGGDPHKGGGGLAVPRGGGRRPLLLLVAPLPALSAQYFWRAEPAVAVYITDPDARPRSLEMRFAELFRLSPAEARLAVRLAEGDTLDEIAAASGVSKYTLRAQLRALMEKTDTHRQAALVRLLTVAARP